MQEKLRAFWLFPVDQADDSWLSGQGGVNAELLRHPRVRGRTNAAIVERLQLGVAFRSIQDPLLNKLALLDGEATRRLVWLVALCLTQRSLQRAIDRQRRGWVLEVVGEDMGFLTRRAALLWREGQEDAMPAMSCAADLRSWLLLKGGSAFATVLRSASDPEAAARILLRLPAIEVRSDMPSGVYDPSALRRLLEKLIEL